MLKVLCTKVRQAIEETKFKTDNPNIEFLGFVVAGLEVWYINFSKLFLKATFLVPQNSQILKPQHVG